MCWPQCASTSNLIFVLLLLIQFANRLVEHGLPKVSVLNGGIDALSEDAGPLLQRSDAQPLL